MPPLATLLAFNNLLTALCSFLSQFNPEKQKSN